MQKIFHFQEKVKKIVLRICRCRQSAQRKEAEAKAKVVHDELTEKIYEQGWLISICSCFFSNQQQVHQTFIECRTFKFIVSATFEKLWTKKWIFYTWGDTVLTGLDGTRKIMELYTK